MATWDRKASDHGNADAVERFEALQQPAPQVLSRQEHDHITEDKLVRKRTQAKQRSERASADSGISNARPSIEDSQRVVDLIRKSSETRPITQAPPIPAPNQPMSAIPENNAAANVSPRIRPAGQNPRQFPNQHRYTLVDPGSGPSGNSLPPSRTQSPPSARQPGRPPGQRSASGPAPGGVTSPVPNAGGPPEDTPPPSKVPQRPAGKGPATFAEMGIQGAKLEEKECIIM